MVPLWSDLNGDLDVGVAVALDIGCAVAEVFGTGRSFRDGAMKNCSHENAGKLKMKEKSFQQMYHKFKTVRVRRTFKH